MTGVSACVLFSLFIKTSSPGLAPGFFFLQLPLGIVRQLKPVFRKLKPSLCFTPNRRLRGLPAAPFSFPAILVAPSHCVTYRVAMDWISLSVSDFVEVLMEKLSPEALACSAHNTSGSALRVP